MVKNDDLMVKAFEGFILGVLESIRTEDLLAMVKSGTIPLIFKEELPSYLNGIKVIIKNNKEKIYAHMNYDYIMSYGQKFRPDLLAVFKHKKGKTWLNRFLSVIRFTIDRMDLPPQEIERQFYERLKQIKEQKALKKQSSVNQILDQDLEQILEQEIEQETETDVGTDQSNKSDIFVY